MLMSNSYAFNAELSPHIQSWCSVDMNAEYFSPIAQLSILPKPNLKIRDANSYSLVEEAATVKQSVIGWK